MRTKRKQRKQIVSSRTGTMIKNFHQQNNEYFRYFTREKKYLMRKEKVPVMVPVTLPLKNTVLFKDDLPWPVPREPFPPSGRHLTAGPGQLTAWSSPPCSPGQLQQNKCIINPLSNCKRITHSRKRWSGIGLHKILILPDIHLL